VCDVNVCVRVCVVTLRDARVLFEFDADVASGVVHVVWMWSVQIGNIETNQSNDCDRENTYGVQLKEK